MPLPEKADSGAPPLKFHCTACGVQLTIDAAKAGITGPCPKCGVRITAPRVVPPATAPPLSSRPVRKTARTHKGRVLADTGIDHAHIQNRESLQSLKVLLFFLLAFGVCFAVLWMLSR